jgi:hypothetical protein
LADKAEGLALRSCAPLRTLAAADILGLRAIMAPTEREAARRLHASVHPLQMVLLLEEARVPHGRARNYHADSRTIRPITIMGS